MEDSRIVVHQANEVDMSYNGAENSGVDGQLCRNVVISIQNLVDQLPHVNGKSSIYRVPKQLRETKNKAYAPQVISIGPFHHGSKDLIAGEQHKLQNFVYFLRRMNRKGSLEFLVQTAQSWIEEARSFYSEFINMKDEEFVKMMLVDGCFIVEFFMLYCDKYYPHPHESSTQISKNEALSFYQGMIDDYIYSDLIKLENQIPFFVLQHLFDLIPEDGRPAPISFIEITYCILFYGLMGSYQISEVLSIKPKHFVDFLSFYFVPRPLLLKKLDHENSGERRLIPPSITELCEAGVIIKKVEQSKCLTNISFKNGVLEIPPLIINDDFEPIMRNMIAFEHFPVGNMNKNVIQYALFMDDLICTDKDVNQLVKAGIITNDIGGSDEEISQLFNNLCKFVVIPPSSHFNHISKALHVHCNGWWNKSKASLKHNYFNTPWAIISFFAATLLIVLTILQTIFSAMSTFPI